MSSVETLPDQVESDLVDGYVTPTEAELKARRQRNWSIAGALLAFIILVFLLTFYQFSKA